MTTTLAQRLKQQLAGLREENKTLRDIEWQQRVDSGEALINQLRGEHWESTQPSLRTVEQNRDALFHSIKEKRK